MIKRYSKNNSVIATLFSFAILGFFVCTFHIAPTIHHDKSTDSHQNNKDSITCFDHELSLSNQKNDVVDLTNISMTEDNYSYLFVSKEIAAIKVEDTFVYRPSDDKPLYIVNNTFLI